MYDPADGVYFQHDYDPLMNSLDSGDATDTLLQQLDTSATSNNDQYYHDLNTHDSGVDLRGQWNPKQPSADSAAYDQLLPMGESLDLGNSPSSANDLMFRPSSSPGDFLGDQSSDSSPEAADPMFNSGSDPLDVAESWGTDSQDAMVMPHSREETPEIYLVPDKTKTRAETQIKMTLTIDPLDHVQHIRFPRKTLAKPKHFASAEEKQEIEQQGGVLDMNVHIVCATAVENPDECDRALRRAAGAEAIPRRPDGVAIADLDKDDPAHPQNGGEVLICDGCKERERKRYDRKKKRGEDEDEFSKYENDRVIMINEKEHKRLKEVEPADAHYTPRAKQVEFAMRIACYCRHQEEKSPMGYRVIFTFTLGNTLLAQQMSEVFHITDDHKNKEIAPEGIPRRITIPHYSMPPFHGQSNVVVPMYQYAENPFSAPMNAYSQPTTPILSHFASSVSPMDSPFPQSAMSTMSQSMPSSISQPMPSSISQPMPSLISQPMPSSISQPMPQSMPSMSQQARQPVPAFAGPSASSNAVTYARHQRGQSLYDTPMMSPTQQLFDSQGPPMPRPQSMDNFNFNFQTDPSFAQTQTNQYFNSAPPSAGGTPVNLSRPASPTWEQGPNKKGKLLRCVYFYMEE
ncbi:SPT3 Dosage dependent suppressor of Ty-induced promoter mutations-like protein [Kalmusia sp. IMI 367209]|nr:SPT3 Dosage dependent suppressor of Ty-induced promoter mutations-like protein [Kalmusia sp. IMI 367209]